MNRFLGRITASARSPGVWPIVIIEAGRSLNGNDYPATMLKREAARGVFEGVTVSGYGKMDANGRLIEDHVAEGFVGLATLNAVGKTRNTRWSESEQAVVGELHLSLGKPEADAYEADLQAHAESGNLDIPGLSIDAYAEQDPMTGAVRAFEACVELTIVTHPSAGGRFTSHRIAASVRGEPSMFTKILKSLRESFPTLLGVFAGPESEAHLAAHIAKRATESADARADLVSGLGKLAKRDRATAIKVGDSSRISESMDYGAMLAEASLIISLVREDIEAQTASAIAAGEAAAPEAPAAPVAPVAPDTAAVQESQADKDAKANAAYLADRAAAERVRESHENIRNACREAKLDDTVADALILQTGTGTVDVETASTLAQNQRAIIDGAIRESQGGAVKVVRESQDKLVDVLAHMLNPTQVKLAESEGDQPWMHSFNEFVMRNFVRSRGAGLREARMEHAQGNIRTARLIREAVDSTAFDQVFADALDRAQLAAYQGHTDWSNWRKIVRQVPYSDFRTHRIINVGYYGNLPTVAKGAPYVQLTTPNDREETIALAKKGGLETITMEDMLNDDLQLWQTLIQRLGQAAQETAHNTVFALIRDATQPTMTDGNPLTDSASRSPVNEGTAALTADATGKTNFVNSVIAMMKQTSGSGQRKGIIPKFGVIPFELMQGAAYVTNQLTGGNTGTDVDQLLKMFGVAIPEWIIDWGTAGTGFATDWYLLADPLRAEVLRFGTLGGRDTPETYIADDGRFGALFTNDQIELKTRFIFAAQAVDYAGIYGNNVA